MEQSVMKYESGLINVPWVKGYYDNENMDMSAKNRPQQFYDDKQQRMKPSDGGRTMTTASENFIIAIIAQAVEDTTYTGTVIDKIKFKMDAINWIITPDPEFINYCKMVGMDPEPIQNKIIENVDMSYTQKQRIAIKKEKIA